jgi:hypothetical protein
MRGLVIKDLIAGFVVIGAMHRVQCTAHTVSAPPDHRTEMNSGVIFSKKTSVAVGVCKSASSCWVPTENHIERMEKELVLFLKNSKAMGASQIYANLASYKRKYYGFKKGKGGDRYIQVNGLCQKYWKPMSLNFSSPNRLMTDMGPCYFLVDYNVERNEFLDFYIDGD